MAVENTMSTLNGLFKTVFADKVEDLIPDNVMLRNMVPFVSKEKQLGLKYSQPVILGTEHGFTYGGTSGDAYSLNEAIASATQPAEIQGYSFVLRSKISYDAVSRSLGNAAAFEQAMKLVVANMLKSFAKRVEMMLFYGQSGIGTVNATVTATSFVVATAQWAPGMWAGAEGMKITIRDGSSLGTNRGDRTVVSVNMETRSVTVDSSIAVTAADVIFHYGAIAVSGSTLNEFLGLHAIISATNAAGAITNLFAINPASYNLWKGNEYGAGSADLSFEKIQKAIARAVEKGLDSDLVCFVNPRTWAKLLTEQAALRMYDESYQIGETEQGSRAIKFYSQNGAVELKPSIYVKESHAFLVDPDCLMRVGSTDITFRRPGRGDEFFRELESSAGYELRAYSDQALFCHAPSRLILINAIVNS